MRLSTVEPVRTSSVPEFWYRESNDVFVDGFIANTRSFGVISLRPKGPGRTQPGVLTHEVKYASIFRSSLELSGAPSIVEHAGPYAEIASSEDSAVLAEFTEVFIRLFSCLHAVRSWLTV